jgi:hypothetical protein
MTINYLTGIDNVYKMPYQAFVNRQAALKGDKPSNIEKSIETETIVKIFPGHGHGTTYGVRFDGRVSNPIKKLSEQYDAITDFNVTPFSKSIVFSFLWGSNKILVQGTGIKLKKEN